MTAEARIQRLRDFSTGERGPYDGIADDLVCVLEALSIAKLALDLSSPHEKALIADCQKHRDENAQLRALLGAALKDTERMDWLEKQSVETIYFHGGKQMNPASLSLRAAIDITPEPV